MKRHVVYLELHERVFARGVGELGKVFPSAMKSFDITITYEDGSPVIELKLDKTRTILIPVALAKSIEVGALVEDKRESKTSSK